MSTYRKLRSLMALNDVDQRRLGLELGMTRQAISTRFTNRTAWNLEEMYHILDFFDVPYDQLHEVFPKNGIGG